MRATNDFPEILPLSVTFRLCLFGCLAVSSNPSLFIGRCLLFIFPFSLFFCLSQFPSLYPSSRFVLFRRLFSIEVRLHAHSRSTGNLLIASFLNGKGRCAASFLAEEISGPDHAIDFHAPLVKVFLSVLLTTSSFVASVGIAGNLNWIFRASIRDASIKDTDNLTNSTTKIVKSNFHEK